MNFVVFGEKSLILSDFCCVNAERLRVCKVLQKMSTLGKLSIGSYSKKYQPKRGGNGGGVSASISIRTAAAAATTSPTANAAENEPAEEEEQNVFHIDKVHNKPTCTRGKEVYILVGAICMALIWLIVLTVYVAVWHSPLPSPPAAGTATKIQPILESSSIKRHFKFPFTLQPDDGSNGRIQTLQIVAEHFTVENVLTYDVCCANVSFFVCRTSAGIKNIGVDAYLSGERSLIVNIIHPDMVGAKCNLLWINRK